MRELWAGKNVTFTKRKKLDRCIVLTGSLYRIKMLLKILKIEMVVLV